MHPAPRALLRRELGDEPWIGFLGYQSSHSTADSTVKWIVQGEPATQWNTGTPKPVINIEPMYEGHMNFAKNRLATALDVRQATWWSLLVSPTAGVSYGAHGVWSWETQPAIPMNHYKTGVARPWHEAIHLPGSMQMKHVRTFFDRAPWQHLRPAQNLLAAQDADVQRFVAVSQSPSHIVAYIPASMSVTLIAKLTRAEWFDPTSGVFQNAGAGPDFTTPGKNTAGDEDWVLLLWGRF
jgi:hypothetical protein